MKYIIFCVVIALFLLVSCSAGYENTNGSWKYIERNEGGKSQIIINVDHATFEILQSKKFAKDKNNAFWKGLKIHGTDLQTFEVVSNDGYSKDKNHVYLYDSRVIGADPRTFTIIKWPYSKDDHSVYNGNLPITVQNINDFEVTKQSIANQSISSKTLFIKRNTDYQWLDTVEVKRIIVNENAEARTPNEKFIGFRKIE